MKPNIRKEVLITNEIRMEMQRSLDIPLYKCASIAVVENLFAGKLQEDLSLYGEYGACLGRLLLENALAALEIDSDGVESYGKAVVVGVDGELEHGSALLHIAFNDPIYQKLKDSKSIIPSTEKVGPAGCTVDVPLHSKRAVKVRSHYDTMEVQVGDSPRPGEIMVVLCITTGSRPFPRIGGLLMKDVKGLDGIS